MKKILVPTDFSQEAKYAFDLAIEFCEKSGATLHLLHVADLPVASDPMGTNLHSYFSPELISQMESSIHDRMTLLSKPIHNVKIESDMVWGNPFGGISRYITENEMDMVIMGTKGATGVKELFIGSNTEKVVRYSKSPVISVKEPIELKNIKNIVFGSRLGNSQTELIIRLKRLQDMLDAKIHIVRINTPSRFKRDTEVWKELEQFAESNEFRNYTLNIFNDFHEDVGLMYFAEKVGADMIALGTHGRSGLTHLYNGSIAEDIVNHAKRPIWTYIIK